MSLIARVRLLVVVLALTGLCGALAISLPAQRDALHAQMSAHDRDTVTLLALLIGHGMPEQAALVETADGLIANGHYREILVRSDGRLVIEHRDATQPRVPVWFTRALALQVQPSVATLHRDDQPAASVAVASDASASIERLWRETRALTLWFAIGALLTCVALGPLLRRLLRPLDAVRAQADALVERRFTQVATPGTVDFVPLIDAMNTLARRAEQRIAADAERIEALDHLVAHDELTGLPNRPRFLELLDAALELDEGSRARRGSLAVLRVADLAGLNRSLGRNGADKLLVDIAARLRGVAAAAPGRVAARLNGSDFVVLAPDLKRPKKLTDEITHAISALRALHGDGLMHRLPVGAAEYATGEPRARLLARLDGALAASEHTGWGDARIVDDDSVLPARTDLAGWRDALLAALDRDQVRLELFPVLSTRGALLYMEGPTRVLIDDLWYGADAFVPWAERLGLTPRLDLAALRLGLKRIDEERVPVGIHVSATSMREAGFVDALRGELQAHPDAAARLWLELPEQGVVRDLAAFRALCLATRPFGCRIGIEHAGREFGQLGGLHDVGLNYIKIDAGFIGNLAANQDKRDFVVRICDLGHAIGLQVIAEGVDHADDLAALGEIGVDGVTGSAVRLPEAEQP
ncbi:bifunctional diguanylate cyclase/phosphodiesterase [Pseudazoarcus pumilus]|nr:EAL domain-containing protein [Pseudazoarcus pumilus]